MYVLKRQIAQIARHPKFKMLSGKRFYPLAKQVEFCCFKLTLFQSMKYTYGNLAMVHDKANRNDTKSRKTGLDAVKIGDMPSTRFSQVFTLPDQGTLGAETAVPPITITSQVKIQ
jgi:hypothetical protein